MDSEVLEIRQRWVIAEQRAINNSFIVSHPDNGRVGYGTLGDYRGAWGIQRILQGGDVYREWFYDTRFNSTADTTADWDITNHNVVFDDGEIVQSSEIIQNAATVTQAQLNADYSGSVSFWLRTSTASAWESITPAAIHTFTNSGTLLYWRGSANGAATLDLLTIEIIT